ncbi:MAG TPA: alpha/beta hydrolase, partial [Bauldia sp.]|nr:alpha/beta hydrolase [Bauldia sp.]
CPTSSDTTTIAGPSAAPPLVLLPAVSVGSVAWFANVAALAARHRVYAVDTIGDLGLSTLAAPVRRPADYAAWLAALFDGLGLDRPAVGGHSYGGWLALTLARHRPDRVGRLVLVAPAAAIGAFRLPVWLMLRLSRFVPLRPDVRRILSAQTAPGFKPDPDFVRLMQAVSRHGRPEVLFPTRFGDAALRAIAAPTLLVLGERETLFDPKAAAERARRLMPDVSVVEIAGAGHLAPMEKPDAVDAAILGFLDEAGA